MKTADLIQIVNGDIDLIDRVNVRDVALFEDRVLITPRHVKKMLINFLQGKITAFELTKWAMFIILRDEYVIVPINITHRDPQYEEIGDYYEDIWNVINRLSTPSIDGEVNTISVTRYLEELDSKYKNDKYAPVKPVSSLWEAK